MPGRIPLAGVRLGLDDDIGGALGGDAAIGMGVEGVGLAGGDQALLGEVREYGLL